MTAGAALDEAGADIGFDHDVTDTVASTRANTLHEREFSLEELPSATDRTGGIARDDVGRRARRHHVADTGADLFREGLCDADSLGIGRLRQIRELRVRHGSERKGEGQREACARGAS